MTTTTPATELTTDQLLATQDAIRLLTDARISSADGSIEVWTFLAHASDHLDRSVRATLRPAM